MARLFWKTSFPCQECFASCSRPFEVIFSRVRHRHRGECPQKETRRDPLVSSTPHPPLCSQFSGASSVAILTGYVDRARVTLAVPRDDLDRSRIWLVELSFSPCVALRNYSQFVSQKPRSIAPAGITGFHAAASVITCRNSDRSPRHIGSEVFSFGNSYFFSEHLTHAIRFYCQSGCETRILDTPGLQ